MENDPDADDAGKGRGTRGQRVWAVLLVLDAFFVVIFGGALAAKVYEHWQSPASARTPPRAAKQAPPVLPPAPRAEKLEPAELAKPVTETARTTPPPEAPAKAPAPAKAASPAPAAESVKLPKPSLIQEAPKRREAPKPQETAKKAQAPEAPAPAPKKDAQDRAKAVSVDFQLKAPGAKSVELAGAFLVRGGGKKSMIKHADGVWTLTVYLTPNTYRYYFLVDGKKKLDPENPKSSRGACLVTVSAP